MAPEAQRMVEKLVMHIVLMGGAETRERGRGRNIRMLPERLEADTKFRLSFLSLSLSLFPISYSFLLQNRRTFLVVLSSMHHLFKICPSPVG